VREADGRDARIVEERSRHQAGLGQLPELAEMVTDLADQVQARALEPSLKRCEPVGHGRGRVEEAKPGDDAQEFVDTGPRDRPRPARGGQTLDPSCP
jgi:hypothetical protein